MNFKIDLFPLSRTALLRDHSFLLKLARKDYQAKEYENALFIIERLAYNAYEYNYLDMFSDDQMEGLIMEISNTLIVKRSCSSKKKERIVFFDSFAFDKRGYTQQYLYALWELGYEVLFIRSNNGGLEYSVNIIEEIKKHPKTELVIVDSGSSYKEQLNLLVKKIDEFAPSKCFLHISPWDVLALLVLNHFPDITKYQIDFTDHAFWLGKRITDKLITFRDFGTNLAIKYRQIAESKVHKIKPYPILDKMPFKGLPKNSNKVIGFTGGSIYKIIDDKQTFLNLLKALLFRHDDFIVFFAQVGDDSFLKKFVDENNLSERLILIGNREDIHKVFENIDIYINTYPYGGGNMILYAATANKPVLSLADPKLLHTHLNNVLEIGEATYSFTTKEAFLKGAGDLIDSVKERQRYGQRLNSAISSPEEFVDNVKSLLDETISNAPYDKGFVIDTDYLTQTHINFNNKRKKIYYKNLRQFGFRTLAKDNFLSLLPAIFFGIR